MANKLPLTEKIKTDNLNKALQKLTLIMTEGKRKPGINPNCRQKIVPEWYEPKTFKHAQHLFSTSSLVFFVAHYYGLMLGLNQTDGLLPLLTTGNSSSVSRLFVRYMSTGRHIRSWFKSDVFDPKTEAYRSLKIVRGLHHQTALKLNDKNQHHLWLSQYAMVGAQFSFMGLLTLFPEKLGFHTFTLKDFHAIFHFWRVIGYCLGMEDRFNLCSGTDVEIVALCRIMYSGSFRLWTTEQREPTGVRMCKAVCAGMASINPLFTYNVLMHYYAPCLDVDPVKHYPLESFAEKIYFKVLSFLLETLCRWRALLWAFSKLADLGMERRMSLVGIMEKKLEKQYSETSIFSPDFRCPMNIRLNYSPAIKTQI